MYFEVCGVGTKENTLALRSKIDRRVAVLAVAVATAVALTSCGTPGPVQSPDGEGAPAANTGSASAWVMSGTAEEAFNASFARWNDAHPDELISTETFANDAYKQKIRPAIGAGEAPTLIYGWGGATLADYVATDSVIDLSDLLDTTALGEDLLPAVLQSGEVDGKLYGIPNNIVKPVVLYYNKDVFNDVGLDVPESWNELMAIVPKLVDAGVAPFSVAGQAQWTLLPYFAYLVDRIGGPDVIASAAEGTPDAWSDPAVTEALVKIQELVDAGGFVNGFASISTDGGADAALLYSGKAAMMLGLPATYDNVKTGMPEFVEEGNLGWAPFPAVDGGKGDPANLTGNPTNFWSVSADATPEQQQAAKDYLGQMMDDGYVEDLIATGGIPPVNMSEDKLAASDDADYFQAMYEMIDSAPSFQLSLDQALPPVAGQELLIQLQQIFLNQITPAEFVDAMNETIGK